MVLLISLSISSDEIMSSPYFTDKSVNLTKEPYQMNYRRVQQKREEMLLHYGYSPSENKVEKRSDLSLQEFWDLYDGKWYYLIYFVFLFFSYERPSQITNFFIQIHSIS